MALRSQVIRLAASLPPGSSERRALLAVVRSARGSEYTAAARLADRIDDLFKALAKAGIDTDYVRLESREVATNLMRLSETYEGSPSFWGDEAEAEADRQLIIAEMRGAITLFRRAIVPMFEKQQRIFEDLREAVDAADKLSRSF